MKNKKTFRRITAALLALILCFGMTATVFAGDGAERNYTITIENSIGGASYYAYKVFDATYGTDESGPVSVAYTIREESEWYALVSEGFQEAAAPGETGAFHESPFHLTKSSDGTCFVVSVKETLADGTHVDDAYIVGWFQAISEQHAVSASAAASGTGNGGELILDVTASKAGYYYVTTSTGAVISLTTTTPSATVQDKNQKPGEGGETPDPGPLPEEPGPSPSLTKDADGMSYTIGDTVKYYISSYAPTYDGAYKVSGYTFTDSMQSGLSYDEGSLNVWIYGTGLTDEGSGTGVYEKQYRKLESGQFTAVYENGKLVISYKIADIEDYPADAVVYFTYTARLSDQADNCNLTNEVVQSWTFVDPDVPDMPEWPKAEASVYTYEFQLKKVDGDCNALDGAVFRLCEMTAAGADSDPYYFRYDEDAKRYTVCEEEKAGAVCDIRVGSATIHGLAQGTYILTEVQAPDGYNLLDAPVTVVITGEDADWKVNLSTDATTGGASADDTHTISVVNHAGSKLPGTGGAGTAIFYVIGSLLVIGAVVLLITRRRMAKTK